MLGRSVCYVLDNRINGFKVRAEALRSAGVTVCAEDFKGVVRRAERFGTCCREERAGKRLPGYGTSRLDIDPGKLIWGTSQSHVTEVTFDLCTSSETTDRLKQLTIAKGVAKLRLIKKENLRTQNIRQDIACP